MLNIDLTPKLKYSYNGRKVGGKSICVHGGGAYEKRELYLV